MTNLRFDAVMSRSLTISTLALLIFLALVVVGIWVMFVWIGQRIGWPPFFTRTTLVVGSGVTLVIVGAVLLSYLYAPRSYVVSGEAITVDRPLQPLTIPLAEISEVRPLASEAFKGTIRTFGSDGLFARIGRFHSPKLGNFRMYATNSDDAVLVDAAERFVLTPSDREKFITEVRSRLNEMGHGEGASEEAEGEEI